MVRAGAEGSLLYLVYPTISWSLPPKDVTVTAEHLYLTLV